MVRLFGITLYIYDTQALHEHAEWMKSFLPENNSIQLYYAVKASSEQKLLETLAPIVDGFEVKIFMRAHNFFLYF